MMPSCHNSCTTRLYEGYRTLLPVVSGFTSLYQGIRALWQHIDLDQRLLHLIGPPLHGEMVLGSLADNDSKIWRIPSSYFLQGPSRWCNSLGFRLYLSPFLWHFRFDFQLTSHELFFLASQMKWRIFSFPFRFKMSIAIVGCTSNSSVHHTEK